MRCEDVETRSESMVSADSPTTAQAEHVTGTTNGDGGGGLVEGSACG